MRKVRVADTERGQEGGRQSTGWGNTGAMLGRVPEAILQTSELILSVQEAPERLPWALTLSEMSLCECVLISSYASASRTFFSDGCFRVYTCC